MRDGPSLLALRRQLRGGQLQCVEADTGDLEVAFA